VVQDGKIIPEVLEARKRGVIMDVAHGGGSFDYTVAESAIEQGFFPIVFPATYILIVLIH